MNFRVGDTVEHKKFGRGKVVEIQNMPDTMVLVQFDKTNENLHSGRGTGDIGPYPKHTCWFCSKYDLTLIACQKMTKDELFKMPLGTIIKTDRDHDSTFVKVGESDFCNNRCDHIRVCTVLENLDLKHYGSKIISIKKPNDYEEIYNFNNQPKEMTIAEIEKVLGHAVKIIKEEE